eukprot:786753-Amphidinium_carterae.2
MKDLHAAGRGAIGKGGTILLFVDWLRWSSRLTECLMVILGWRPASRTSAPSEFGRGGLSLGTITWPLSDSNSEVSWEAALRGKRARRGPNGIRNLRVMADRLNWTTSSPPLAVPHKGVIGGGMHATCPQRDHSQVAVTPSLTPPCTRMRLWPLYMLRAT